MDKTIQLVIQTVNSYFQAYENKDIQTINALLAPQCFCFGAGLDETYAGKGAVVNGIQLDFENSKSASLSFNCLNAGINADTAWVAGECAAQMETIKGEQLSFQGRSTAVLTRQSGKWYICQFHFSFPSAQTDQ